MKACCKFNIFIIAVHEDFQAFSESDAASTKSESKWSAGKLANDQNGDASQLSTYDPMTW